MSSLNELLEKPDGSIPGINISNLLDSVPNEDRNKTLGSILTKIRYNGHIELTGTDLDEVLRAASQGYITHEQIIALLYDGRQSVSTCDLMVSILTSFNYKIVSQRINHYIYYIKAQRCPPTT